MLTTSARPLICHVKKRKKKRKEQKKRRSIHAAKDTSRLLLHRVSARDPLGRKSHLFLLSRQPPGPCSFLFPRLLFHLSSSAPSRGPGADGLLPGRVKRDFRPKLRAGNCDERRGNIVRHLKVCVCVCVIVVFSSLLFLFSFSFFSCVLECVSVFVFGQVYVNDVRSCVCVMNIFQHFTLFQ